MVGNPPGILRAAMVTGGAKRVGAAIVEALAAEGFAVGIHCRASVAEAESLAERVRGQGGRAAVLQANLNDEDAVRRLLPAAEAALGPVGVLINNASVFERDEWDDASRQSWDRHMEPNLRAPFVLMQALAKGLPDGAEGVVVNMLDQRVWSLTPHFVSYTASKAALWSLTRQMALALAPRVRVNAVGPGPALPSARQSAEQFARQCASVPLGRGTDPGEIARAVLALISMPSVTGQMLALDGGQHLQWSPTDGGASAE